MTEFRYLAADEGATDRLGRLLAEVLPPGTVVGLVGTLGSGKTRLVQSVASALGVSRTDVTSPTFVLVSEYRGGRMPIYHFDTYRLRDEDEFLQLGPEEYFDGPGLCFVEWADRVERCLPGDRLTIIIDVLDQRQRSFLIAATSPTLEPYVRELQGRASPTAGREKS